MERSQRGGRKGEEKRMIEDRKEKRGVKEERVVTKKRILRRMI